MAEFICEYCGKTFTGENIYHEYRFCSRECAVDGRSKPYDVTLDWKKEQGKWLCPYNEGCACRWRNCFYCGWNPDVLKKRMKKMEGEENVL